MPPLDILECPEDKFLTLRTFFAAAGTGIRDLVALGYRYDRDAGMRAEQMESWLLRYEPDPSVAPGVRMHVLGGGAGWMTGMWLAPSGRLWACDVDGLVYRQTGTAKGGQATFERDDLDVELSGVWGLHDELVYAWSETRRRLFRWTGRKWEEMECPGAMLNMHGVAPDDLLAVGYQGLVARWNGRDWRRLSIANGATFSGVHMASSAEAYACNHVGELLEIAPSGHRVCARFGAPLLDVRAWHGAVYVAAGENGLQRRVPDALELEEVSGDFVAESFGHCENALLIVADTALVAMDVAGTFDHVDAWDFYKAFKDSKPRWLP